MEVAIRSDQREQRAFFKNAVLVLGTRYLVLFMGAVLLVWQGLDLMKNHQAITLSAVFQVAVVVVLVPAIVWASDREMRRLGRELERKQQEVEQRSRELNALNRLFQSYLAERFTGIPGGESGHIGPKGT